MADYAISNVPRRVVYAASGTGPYAFTFEILNQTDIAVYKASTLLTLTTDYTVTINANGTGSVTLVTSAGTSNITIVGSKNIQRTTDFTTGGDLFANTLNDELDNQTIFIQQVAETAERGLKAPVTDPTDIAMTLPAKDGRKGKVLAFDSTTGNPVAGPALDAVTTVIEQSANINTVAANIGSVNTVAGNTSNINTVAGVSSNVTTVATNIANVNAVGADLLEATSEINTVAVDIANVNNVGNNIGNVNTVAGISANVTSVAGNASNINTVAGNNTNVTTVAGISGNVTTVAGISANVTTVAGINAAVSTVATNNANVSTVATNIAAVNTNATNIVAIQNASTNATNAATSATAAQTAQSAAESARDATLAAYDNFDDRYLGSKTSNPTLDNDGNALVAGALYFNSVSGAMQVYTGSAWVAAYVSGTGFLASANNLSDVASTSSARTNLGVTATGADTAYAFRANNLSDLASASTARTNLGLAIGTNVQAYDAQLDTLAGMSANRASFLASENSFTFRNRIINGDMSIDQRNAGASVTNNGSISQYSVDRWNITTSVSSKFTVQQNAGSVTPPAGFRNYLGVTSTAATSLGASDYYMIRQQIEGFNTADFNYGTANAQTVTLSFWVRSSLTGQFGGALTNDSDAWCPFSYTISAANTWEYKTITITGATTGTWNTTNGQGLSIRFSLGIGSIFTGGTSGVWSSSVFSQPAGSVSVVGTNGATFYITGVQLEKGSVATSFDYLPYGTELQLCQRYTWVTNSNSISTAIGNGGTDPWCNVIIPVIMRSTPTLTVTGTLCVSDQVSVDAFAASPTVPNSNLANNGGRVRIAGWGVTLTSNRVFTGTAAGGSGTLTFNAEL